MIKSLHRKERRKSTQIPLMRPGTEPLVDCLGRKLTFRTLTLLDQQDLIGSMPVEHSRNDITLGRAMIAAGIATINGEFMPVPRNEQEYREMFARIGMEGLASVINYRL